jgi:hypothetical protein
MVPCRWWAGYGSTAMTEQATSHPNDRMWANALGWANMVAGEATLRRWSANTGKK